MNKSYGTARQLAGSFITVALVGAFALAGPGNANAQANKEPAIEIFEAAEAPPPEEAALERAAKQKPETPARARGHVDELVAQIARQRAGQERLERARKGGRPEHVLTASRQPPPGAAELEKQKPPAPPRSMRPTRQELEEAISRQEGGRGKLDRARRGGRPDQPPGRTSALQRVGEWFDWLPDLISTAHAAGELSVTLTPQVNSYGSHRGLYHSESGGLYAYATIYGAHVNGSSPSATHVSAYPHQRSWDTDTRSGVEHPYISLAVRAPRDGYYIVNTRAYGPAGVQLRRYQYPGYPVVQTFDASGSADRPALVYLAEGYHYFYWVSPGSIYVYSASVDSYP